MKLSKVLHRSNLKEHRTKEKMCAFNVQFQFSHVVHNLTMVYWDIGDSLLYCSQHWICGSWAWLAMVNVKCSTSKLQKKFRMPSHSAFHAHGSFCFRDLLGIVVQCGPRSRLGVRNTERSFGFYLKGNPYYRNSVMQVQLPHFWESFPTFALRIKNIGLNSTLLKPWNPCFFVMFGWNIIVRVRLDS